MLSVKFHHYCLLRPVDPIRLPDTVSDEEGAMLEPLAVAVYSCRRAEVGLGAPVLVLGAGPIGLVAILTAKAMGAGPICVTGQLSTE